MMSMTAGTRKCDMPRTLPKYVVEDRTDGVSRFYFRRKDQPKIRIEGTPGTEEFMRQYYAARDGKPQPQGRGPKRSEPGTFRWLSEQYFQSAEYKRLDARTRLVRKQIVEHMWAEPVRSGGGDLFEDMPLSRFTAKAVRVLRDRKAEFPEAANSRIKALRAIFAWSILPDVEMHDTNPARDVSYFRSQGEGFHSWTDEEVAQFEARHPRGTKARLALDLMLYTSQRRSDAILFGRQHVANGWLRFTQVKGAKKKPIKLELPIHPELQKTLDASTTGNLTFLITEFDKPFTAAGFGNYFRRRCDEAGLPHCTAHGLRKVAARRMAERGASEKQIMSVTGHTTSKEVTRYTKAARQKVLARDAIELLGRPETLPETGE